MTYLSNMQEEPIVKYLSASAIKAYFASPAKFWSTYVARNAITSSLTMETGTAWHKGVESLCLGSTLKTAIKRSQAQLVEGFKTLPQEDQDIEALSENLKALAANLTTYSQEEKAWILVHDANGNALIEVSGAYIPEEGAKKLPIKGRMDAIVELPGSYLSLIGELEGLTFDETRTYEGILDHKYVSKREGQAGEGGSKFFHAVQAYMYYYSFLALRGFPPTFFAIGQFKASKNRDKTSQYKEQYILYTPTFLEKMDKFYIYLCEDLLSRKHFLPNPFQSYGNEDWKDFLNSEHNELI